MTGLEFDRWMRGHRMSRVQCAAFFKRKPRTIDAWRKSRIQVPALIEDICKRTPPPEKKRRAKDGLGAGGI